MKNIAVIGRSLGSSKWETLFDILDQGVEAEYWIYTRYDVDKLDRAQFNSQEFDCHILVATKTVSENIPNVRFFATASEDEIIEKMQALANSICGEENGDIPTANSDDIADVSEVDVRHIETVDISDTDSSSTEVCDSSFAYLYDAHNPLDPDSCRHLVAIELDINGESVTLSYEDANRLKEMMQIMKEYGFGIKRVITGHVLGDD